MIPDTHEAPALISAMRYTYDRATRDAIITALEDAEQLLKMLALDAQDRHGLEVIVTPLQQRAQSCGDAIRRMFRDEDSWGIAYPVREDSTYDRVQFLYAHDGGAA